MSGDGTTSGVTDRRVVLLGGRGQLGAALADRLGEDAVPLSRQQFDLAAVRQPADFEPLVNDHAATHIVNCAAFNGVDLCETDEDASDAAFLLNRSLVGRLADWCASRELPLIHISTDYVYTAADPAEAGLHGWTESDRPAPGSVYSATKLGGEQLALAAGATVLRTCGLYGVGWDRANVRKAGGNFVETMLRLADAHDEVRIVADQVCTPTSCDDLADWIAQLIMTGAPAGLYHATNAGRCSWSELAEAIFAIVGHETRVVPISTDEFGAAAQRPRFSVLDGSKLDAALGIERPDWRDALGRYLAGR